MFGQTNVLLKSEQRLKIEASVVASHGLNFLLEWSKKTCLKACPGMYMPRHNSVSNNV